MTANAAHVLNAIPSKAQVVIGPIFLTTNTEALHYRIGNVAARGKASDSPHCDLGYGHPQSPLCVLAHSVHAALRVSTDALLAHA